MRRHHIAYRHPNGEVEGFVGYGSTDAAAEVDAVRHVRAKAEHTGGYDPARLITGKTGLTLAELALIRRDWKTAR